MKNLEELISRTAERRRVFAGKRYLDYVVVTYSEALLIKAEVDARIAELTAEVARLRGLVKDAYEEGANDGYDEAVSGERGHGDRHAEWEASEAYKEVVRLEFPECSGDEISCPENEGYGCCIARNALKEGV